ncbi:MULTISPECIES: hypothetical protein [unclassified Mesorhizobium]|nr:MULTISPECIES: hypothetical protein [unclassified Mesorhizobium]
MIAWKGGNDGVEQAPTTKGKPAAKGLRHAAARDERKTEAETGSKQKL